MPRSRATRAGLDSVRYALEVMLDLNEQTRRAWDANAAHWDSHMGDGNDFQRFLVAPSTERLLNLSAGELVLDVACGNGAMARRLVEVGARVVAFDFSEGMIEAARARGDSGGAIDYRVIDATDPVALHALGTEVFDAAICNMGFMDISDISPLLQGVATALKPSGRFVFSLCHPCFNTTGCGRQLEDGDEGGLVTKHAVRVFKYSSLRPSPGVALRDQPQPHIYFDRTLGEVFAACFEAGFAVTGLEEPVFPDGSGPSESRHLDLFREIPPVMAVRLERFNPPPRR